MNYYIYNDWLVSTQGLTDLKYIFSDFCQSAHKSSHQHTACQLWYSLTGNTRNVYDTPMPFLMRAVFDSNTAKRPGCRVLVLPDKWFPGLLVPTSKKINEVVFLLSASVCIEIREKLEDAAAGRDELWGIPRDFNALEDALPTKRCYVQLFLKDLRYVSDMEACEKEPWFEGLRAPIMRTWKEFTQTFWGDDSSD
jgi:hypothetical protein